MQQRLPSLLDPPLAFAHRGARAHAPENTIEAFNLALRLGATGLESDVWITADGEAVLDHDGVVKSRLGRRRSIRESARRSLPGHIPTVSEFLDSCPGEFAFSVDVKDPDAIHPMLDAIRGSRPDLENRLWVCHHDWRIVASWRSLTHAKLVDSTRLARMKEGPERRAATLAEVGIDAVNMHHSDWSGGLVTLFHRFERLTLGWDMQHDYVLDAGLRMGLDGVFSDHTDRMMDAFDRHV